MSSYPLGGIVIQNNDTNKVELFNNVFDTETFLSTGDAPQVDLAGLILARNVAGTNLVAYVAAQAGVDATGTPVAVLGSDVNAAATAAVEDIRVIVSGSIREPLVHTALAPTVAITNNDKDRLRSTGLIPLAARELANFDNPQP